MSNPLQDNIKADIEVWADDLEEVAMSKPAALESLTKLRNIAYQLLEDNVTLSMKCKEHYERVQQLLNSQLGRGELRRVYGKVNDEKGTLFSIKPDGNDLREEVDLPEQLKKPFC